MTGKVSSIAMSVLFLLGAALLPLATAGGSSPGDVRPMATEITSDITVSSGTVMSYDNVSYTMKANITIYGTLYINYSFFEWGGRVDGLYGLYIRDGGTLLMKNTNMTALDKVTRVSRPGQQWSWTWGYHWKFEIYGNARVTKCDLSYMWGKSDTGSILDLMGGVSIYSDFLSPNVKFVEIRDTKIFNTEQCGVYMGSTTGATAWTSYPKLINCLISNSTSTGIVATGATVAPEIEGCTIIGHGYKGGNYYYGASGVIRNSTFSNNQFFGFSYDPVTGGTKDMYIYNSKFTYNKGSGYAARRGGTANLYNCVFNNNREHGINLKWENPLGLDTNVPYFKVFGGEAKNNMIDGIGCSYEECRAEIVGMDIGWNGRHGVRVNTPQMQITLMDSTIHDNKGYGIYSNQTQDTFINNKVFKNAMGNVVFANSSKSTIYDSQINNSKMGVRIDTTQMSGIYDCEIFSNQVGLLVKKGTLPIIYNNTFSENGIGLELLTDGLNIGLNRFEDNDQAGLLISDAKNTLLSFLEFEEENNALSLIRADQTTLLNVTVKDSVTGVEAKDNMNFTVIGSVFDGNLMDFSLDNAATGKAYAIGTDPAKVKVNDTASLFTHSWRIYLEVFDNVTYFPVQNADVVVLGANGEPVMERQTMFDGTVGDWATNFSVSGGVATLHSPINITISKLGYIPYWGSPEPFNGEITRTVLLALNQPPILPVPLNYTPQKTHNNRPLITWSNATDWNMDVIKYKVNVYQDEPYSDVRIVEDAIVRQSSYLFTKNLRYNHEYWVEIESFDPWGLTDSALFSFSTVNTPPSIPMIGFVRSPVSTRDDIEVKVLENATDMDLDPVDKISYLVEWYAFREGFWVIIYSGSDAFVLPSNMTMEGDSIKAVVKAFDGIEYGSPVSIQTRVLNFAPRVLVESVEVDINEDEVAVNKINLEDYFIDDDGDKLTYNVRFQRHVSVEIEPSTNNLSFTPDENWIGTDYVLIEALDSKAHDEEWAVLRINITALGVNDEPLITRLNDEPVKATIPLIVQATQGSWVLITVSATDPDEVYGDTFTFSTNIIEAVGGGIIGENDLQFENGTGRLSLFLTNPMVGEHYFNISVTDEEGADFTAIVHLIVDNINEKPSTPRIVNPANDAYLIQPLNGSIAFDAEGADDPDLHIPGSSERLEYDWDFGEGYVMNQGLNVAHQFLVSGPYTVKLRVRDTMGLSSETTVKITVNVTEPPPPTPPEEQAEPFLKQYGLILILVITAIVILLIVLFLVFRKEPLAEVAAHEEKAHEELVAKQQQDALAAQEKLQALLGAIAPAAGPALPSATTGAGIEALPPATAPVPEQPMPMPEPVPAPAEPQPYYDQAAIPPEMMAPPPAPEPQPVPTEAVYGSVPVAPQPVGQGQVYLPPTQ